jgi:hypothetical protein
MRWAMTRSHHLSNVGAAERAGGVRHGPLLWWPSCDDLGMDWCQYLLYLRSSRHVGAGEANALSFLAHA